MCSLDVVGLIARDGDLLLMLCLASAQSVDELLFFKPASFDLRLAIRCKLPDGGDGGTV